MRRTSSKVKRLPKDLRAAIDRAIVAGLTYDEIAVKVSDWVRAGKIAPESAPSRAGIGRYAPGFLAKLEKLNLVREQARAIVSQSEGNGLEMEEAAVSLVLNEIMTVLMPQEQDKQLPPKAIASVAQALSRLQSSSATRERAKLEIARRAKEIERMRVTTKAAEFVQDQGLSAEQVSKLRKFLLQVS